MHKLFFALFFVLVLQKAFAQNTDSSTVASPPTPEAPPVVETSAPVSSPTETVTPPVTSTNEESSPSSTPKPPPILDGFGWDPSTLRASPDKNGFQASEPELRYEVTPNGTIILADIAIDEDTFRVFVGYPKGLYSQLTPETKDDSSVILYFSFPSALGQKGSLEVVGENGKTLLSKKLKTDDYLRAQKALKMVKPNYAPISTQTYQVLLSAPQLKSALFASQRRMGIRFCWNQTENEYFLRICSPYYRYSPKEKQMLLQNQVAENKVFLEHKEEKLRSALILKPEQKIRLLATSSKRFTVELFTQVHPLNVIDIYQDETKSKFYLVGHSNSPNAVPTKTYPVVPEDSLTALFNFNPTIGDLKTYWVSELPSDASELIMPGRGGAPINYPFQMNRPLSLDSRVRLKSPLRSTYRESVILKGSVKSGVTLIGDPPESLTLNPSNQEFEWKFPAIEKGKEKEGTLTLKEKENEYRLNYSLYRGFASDISLRLGTVVQQNFKMILLGEITYGQWFESLFGWENDLFSRHRWGLFARHIDLVKTDSPLLTNDEMKDNRRTNVAFKYRFTPGLWERDESWGLVFGLEDLSMAGVKGTFGGGGFFWARSMPQIFDDLFNLVPIMRYPKWVDMDFVIYPLELSSNSRARTTPNAALNFHGKVSWTETLFGEMGFGVLNYDFESDVRIVNFQALYGTFGLGYKF